MKHAKHLLIVFAALLCSLTASARVEIDGIWYDLISKGEVAEVSGNPDGTKYSGAVIIPSSVTYEGVEYSVTTIGRSVFSDCINLTSITIPEGVTIIGDGAFHGCSSLTSITIPRSVTRIEDALFSDCSSLTTITIPESVTSIGGSAFAGCSSLTAITIPVSVTSIEGRAFSDCSSLTSIIIPEGVTTIGYSVFRDCINLTSITIPEGVTSIGNYAFFCCSSLTSITIPVSVTSIGDEAFGDCSSLTTITIPEGVTSIGNYAFYGCSSSLTSIVVAEGNTNFDSRNGCNAIIETNGNILVLGCSSTTIPEGVTSIGWYAFYGCRSLTSITLPESVTGIGTRAFANCPELLDVYCNAKTAPKAEPDAFGVYPYYGTLTLHVPASAIESYKAKRPWSSFGNIVALTDEEMGIDQLTIDKQGSLAEGKSNGQLGAPAKPCVCLLVYFSYVSRNLYLC